MIVAMVLEWDLLDSMIDPESPAGVTPAGHDRLHESLFDLNADAVYELGTGVVVVPMAACDHPWEKVDGEYLRCGVCGTIIGRS